MKKITFIIKIIILIFFIIIIVYISLRVYAFITPKFNINITDNIIYYDKYGNDIFAQNDDNYVKLENISNNVIDAIISIEDKNFYHHNGFDLLRIIKAITKLIFI